MGSFYLPASMMVFVYARIFMAAKKRARKNITKKDKKLEAASMKEGSSGDGNGKEKGECHKTFQVKSKVKLIS